MLLIASIAPNVVQTVGIPTSIKLNKATDH
jgi:hypothetical protein